MKLTTKLWIAIAIFALISPLGLVLSSRFKAGPAWGEWRPGDIQKSVGYVPRGLARAGETWKAPMPDYAFKGWDGKGMTHLSFAYIVSASLGIAVIALVAWAIGECLARKGE